VRKRWVASNTYCIFNFFTNSDEISLFDNQAILLGLGLQHKSVNDLEKELDLPATQLLGLFNRSMKKLVQVMHIVVCPCTGV
jgi:N-acetyltransferase 10